MKMDDEEVTGLVYVIIPKGLDYIKAGCSGQTVDAMIGRYKTYYLSFRIHAYHCPNQDYRKQEAHLFQHLKHQRLSERAELFRKSKLTLKKFFNFARVQNLPLLLVKDVHTGKQVVQNPIKIKAFEVKKEKYNHIVKVYNPTKSFIPNDVVGYTTHRLNSKLTVNKDWNETIANIWNQPCTHEFLLRYRVYDTKQLHNMACLRPYRLHLFFKNESQTALSDINYNRRYRELYSINKQLLDIGTTIMKAISPTCQQDLQKNGIIHIDKLTFKENIMTYFNSITETEVKTIFDAYQCEHRTYDEMMSHCKLKKYSVFITHLIHRIIRTSFDMMLSRPFGKSKTYIIQITSLSLLQIHKHLKHEYTLPKSKFLGRTLVPFYCSDDLIMW